jgi:hypothetical protein
MLEEVGDCSICRDEACEIEGLHAKHELHELGVHASPTAHHRPKAKPPWQQPDPDGLLKSILDANSEIRPKWFQEIAPDVRDDFGNVTDRSIWRGLKKLVERGQLLRLDLGLAFHAYIKPCCRRPVGRPATTEDMREYMLSIVEIHPMGRDS